MLAQVIAAGLTFARTPVTVDDGDCPVWYEEGPKVRPAGVAAREMDRSCRRYQPCPAVGEVDARDRLARLFRGARDVRPEGHIVVRSAVFG